MQLRVNEDRFFTQSNCPPAWKTTHEPLNVSTHHLVNYCYMSKTQVRCICHSLLKYEVNFIQLNIKKKKKNSETDHTYIYITNLQGQLNILEEPVGVVTILCFLL